MVIKRSSAGEVARLVDEALGDDRVGAEAAVARLAIAGARAVDRVIGAFEGATPRQQATLLQVLERIGEPRALPVAEGLLDSPDDRLAAAAVGALRPLLQAERSDVADRAVAAVTRVALDPTRPDAVRAAALDALHDLGAEPMQAVALALEHDPSRAVRRLAGWTSPVDADRAAASSGPVAQPAAAAELRQAAQDATLDLETWATGGLPDDPELVRTAAAEAVVTVPLGDLHRLVVAVRDRETATRDELRRKEWMAARGALHQALAARGSRVALYDLRETLERPGAHLPISMVTALSAIGDASCLEPLAAAIAASHDAWEREQLSRTFGEIRRRERLTRRHAVIRRIEGKYGTGFGL